MSVLDRVKLFLPELKLANEELADRIKSEGVDSVQIDAALSEGGGDEDEDEEGGGDVVGAEMEGQGKEEKQQQKIIQLEFLLGDVPDDNPIALAEAEAEQEAAETEQEAKEYE